MKLTTNTVTAFSCILLTCGIVCMHELELKYAWILTFQATRWISSSVCLTSIGVRVLWPVYHIINFVMIRQIVQMVLMKAAIAVSEQSVCVHMCLHTCTWLKMQVCKHIFARTVLYGLYMQSGIKTYKFLYIYIILFVHYISE